MAAVASDLTSPTADVPTHSCRVLRQEPDRLTVQVENGHGPVVVVAGIERVTSGDNPSAETAALKWLAERVTTPALIWP